MTRAGASTVSIIVPTLNRAPYLTATLNNLLVQTVPTWELFVVNDGCSDDTEAVLQAYADHIVYLAQPNAGKYSAINHALHRAPDKYVWVFDDGDLACNDALARHFAVLERQPEVACTISGSSYVGT